MFLLQNVILANRNFEKTDLPVKSNNLRRIRRKKMLGNSCFKIENFTWKQKLNCCNDFGSYRMFIVHSVHGELNHHFVSHDAILELVILNLHLLFSPKCWNVLNSGNRSSYRDPGPQKWRRESPICTVPMSNLSDLRDGGLENTYLYFLLDDFWNICKISVEINKMLLFSITFNGN